ncbi:MAG: hypothetical protein ACXWH0_03825 [Acidimicrobiia bacterium]
MYVAILRARYQTSGSSIRRWMMRNTTQRSNTTTSTTTADWIAFNLTG